MAWDVPNFSLANQPTISANWSQPIVASNERRRERQTMADQLAGREQAIAEARNPDGSVNWAKASEVLMGRGDVEGTRYAASIAENEADNSWRRDRAAVEDKQWAASHALAREKAGREGQSGGVFGTPIYGEDPETGQTALGVIGKDGQFRRVDTGGVRVTPGVTFQDLGTSRQGFNTKTGAPVGSAIPIDNTGKAADVAEGKGVGEARTSYLSMNSKMPGLEKVIGELNTLADQATYTMTGQALDAGRRQIGMAPRDAAIARTKYVAMVDNQVLPLLRDTFGAAFTVQEGQSLRATLGDPDKTPAEKKAVLESFIEQKRRDVESLALQALGGQQQGGSQPPPQQAPQAPAQINEGARARNPSTGQMIEFRGGQWVPVQ